MWQSCEKYDTMRILQLCKKFPYPLKDGESLAVTYLSRAMAELGCTVTLLAMNTRKHWVDVEQAKLQLRHYEAIYTTPLDNRIKPLRALLNLCSNRSYHIERFEDAAFEAKLLEILQTRQFDVIQLETLYLAPYLPVIRRHSNAAVVLRAHNVEHEIWERMAANSHFLKKWYLDRITPRLRAYEISRLNQYDLVVGITARDVQIFRELGLAKPAVIAPIGLDADAYAPDLHSYDQPLSMAFIGSLDWMPNLEGLEWFLESVWKPILHPQFPDLQLHVAGRNMPERLRRLGLRNVFMHGETPDAADFLRQHTILVVPLQSGGGMRAKILEGMALSRVVLSTALGLEGIPATHGAEALIADTPAAFARAVEYCYAHPDNLKTIGRQARVFFEKNYDNQTVARDLLHAYQQLIHTN
jgi:glycosyltransferase involved in cell wall biosynthesis